MRFAAFCRCRVLAILSTVKTSKWHTMINLERYGEAQAALCRICEIRQDRLAVLRIQLIKQSLLTHRQT
jgi:hypothetical protein